MKAYSAFIFDMDGTLTVPTLDFRKIRRELGVPDGEDLLEFHKRLPETEKAAFMATIERHERDAARDVTLQEGAAECLASLGRRGKLGIITRNRAENVRIVIDKLGARFDAVLTRDFEPVKPHPAPVLKILRDWGVDPALTLVVGDYRDDLLCARAAGADACFFFNPGATDWSALADFVVRSYAELQTRLG